MDHHGGLARLEIVPGAETVGTFCNRSKENMAAEIPLQCFRLSNPKDISGQKAVGQRIELDCMLKVTPTSEMPIVFRLTCSPQTRAVRKKKLVLLCQLVRPLFTTMCSCTILLLFFFSGFCIERLSINGRFTLS